jgi:hypothetical protein
MSQAEKIPFKDNSEYAKKVLVGIQAKYPYATTVQLELTSTNLQVRRHQRVMVD